MAGRRRNAPQALFLIVTSGLILPQIVLADEICTGEDYSTSCGPGEVILASHALYGRMRQNRCVKIDYGYIGCNSEVLGVVDSYCSGRRACTLDVPNPLLDTLAGCPLDFKSYLEVNHTCLRVLQKTRSGCRSPEQRILTREEGIIASSILEETGCASMEAPLTIEAYPGQRISFSLMDFSYFGRRSDFPPVRCQNYALLKETDDDVEPHTVCGSNQRNSHAYTSKSHVVQVSIFQETLPDGTRPHFLLKYKIEGCRLPPTPPNSWLTLDNNSILVKCNYSDITFTLRCVNQTWDGPVGNCSEPINEPQHGVNITYDLAIALIIAIALVIACCILCVGIIFMKGRQSQNRSGEPHSSPCHMERYDRTIECMDPSYAAGTCKDVDVAWNYDQCRTGENLYASIQETPTLHRCHKQHGGCEPGAPCQFPRQVSSPTSHGTRHPGGAVVLHTPYGTLPSHAHPKMNTLGGGKGSMGTFAPITSGEGTGNSAQPNKEMLPKDIQAASRQYFVFDPNNQNLDQSQGQILEPAPEHL